MLAVMYDLLNAITVSLWSQITFNKCLLLYRNSCKC